MQRALIAAIGTLAVSGVVVSAQQPGRLVNPRAEAAKASAPSTTTVTTSSKGVRLLPGTRPNVLTTIQGSALNSTNGILPDIPVRLRDVRFGRVVDTTTTDKAGVFTFHAVDPGSYVVELVGNDSQILAASQILNVDAGSAVTALVKMPFKFPPFGGILGHTATSALTVSSAAAASGVLGIKVASCVSPPCN